MGQLLDLSPPSIFVSEIRSGGYSKFEVLSKDLCTKFLKIDLKKKLQGFFLGFCEKLGFLRVFQHIYVNNFFLSHFSKILLQNFFKNRFRMLNLKYYFCTFKTLGGDSKTSWWNTPKKRYWVIYIQSFCLVFWIWTFNFHKKQELIFLHHFPPQEHPLPFPIYSASTERILFGFVVFFQSEECDFDAKVALKKILMRECCRCCCKEMNEWRMRRKL